MKKNLLFMMIILVFVLSSCSSGEESAIDSNVKKQATELKVAINAQPNTLDPHITTAGITRDISRNIYEQLVVLNDKYEVVPELAEKVEQSGDNKKFTFILRKGVKFHNGKKLTADDVVASMNRWIENFGTIQSVVGDARFKKVDDYKVEIQLSKGVLEFQSMIAGAKQLASIMPEEVINNAAANGVTETIGTGPFSFIEWKSEQYIHLKKFKDYQSIDIPSQGLAGTKELFINNLYFYIVTDASTRLAGLQTGEYHIARSLSYDDFDMIENNSDLASESELLGDLTIVYNKKSGLMANQKMRQAINATLDIDEIMMGAGTNEKFYRMGSSYMFEEQEAWFSESGSEHYNQKNEKIAKQLLKEAGYNGEELVMVTNKEYPQFYNATIVIKDQLERIGVKVRIDVYDWATQLEIENDPDKFDLYVMSYSPVTTPTSYLYLSPTYSGWTDDKKISKLMDKIDNETTREDAKAAWDELQGYMWESLPITSLGDIYTLTGRSKKVSNLEFFQGPIFWNVKVAE